MIGQVVPDAASAAVLSGEEIAFLDVREAGPFSQGHPLFAVPCAYSLFERRLGALVPRRDVPILLIDAGDGRAQDAAEAAGAMGYANLSVVTGGIPGWAAARLPLYKGVNVPSKTLGELAEHLWAAETIDAATLAEWQARGKPFQFFDCRPAEEAAKMTVPGAACVPNGELAHRLDAVPPEGPIVLTCAGRTRGLIGALGLGRVAGGRKVLALENGTQGWALAGLALDRGRVPAPLPPLDQAALDSARARSAAFLAAEAIPEVTAREVRRLRAEPGRSTFLLDVRSGEEAAGDPLRAFTHALSGQLVQATDQWVGVRGARLVLADDAGLRAGLAAYWLRMLGFEVMVARIDDALRALEPHPVAQPPAIALQEIAAADALSAHRQGRGRIVDLRSSSRHCAGHVEGALWANRSDLAAVLALDLPIYMIGDRSGRADLVARDLMRAGRTDLFRVAGGMQALTVAGAKVVEAQMPLHEAVDITSFAHGRHDGDLDASRLYLTWEQGLVAQLAPDERAAFRI